MYHIKDIKIINYMTGRIDPKNKIMVKRHLYCCDNCAGKLQKYFKIWNLLGKWKIFRQRD